MLHIAIRYFTKYHLVPIVTLIFIVLASTFLLWLPFLFKIDSLFGLEIPNSSFQYIYRHFDGPLYIIPAKTFYNPQTITNLHLEMTSPPIYFAAHFPLYPLLIRLFAPSIGYLKSMLFVNILSTIFLTLFFFTFVRKLKLTHQPLILTSIFLFLPRFMVVRSVGAPESLFILFILLSLFFFEKENYLFAGIFGGLATLTKAPGILLFLVYLLTLLEKKILASTSKKPISNEISQLLRWSFIFLIPFSLFLVFALYAIQFHDFFAYFHSGDNIHLVTPFSVFNFKKIWVGTAWLEDIIFYYFFYLLTVIYLKDIRYRSFFYFALVFFTATVFIQHRDIARYSLPLWPLACIALEKFFISKKFLIVFIVLLAPVFLYSWNFLLYNVMPISNWTPFI